MQTQTQSKGIRLHGPCQQMMYVKYKPKYHQETILQMDDDEQKRQLCFNDFFRDHNILRGSYIERERLLHLK